MSTRSESLAALDIPELDSQILLHIYSYPGQSRAQIANGTGRRLSSVCGAVNRLTKRALVTVIGEIYDTETSRNVESLDVTDKMIKVLG